MRKNEAKQTEEVMCLGCDQINELVVDDNHMFTCPECLAEQYVCDDCPMVDGEHSFDCMTNWK